VNENTASLSAVPGVREPLKAASKKLTVLSSIETTK